MDRLSCGGRWQGAAAGSTQAGPRGRAAIGAWRWRFRESRAKRPFSVKEKGVMRVGVIGATGAVGKELVEVLGKRRFPVTELKLFASARSAGLKQATPWGEVRIEEYSDAAAFRLDLALLAVSGDFAKAHAR